MEYLSLFEQLERQLLDTLEEGSEDMVDVVHLSLKILRRAK